MNIDDLIFILDNAKDFITRPIDKVECVVNDIRVTMVDGTYLYFSNIKVVNDDDTGQTRNSSDADEQTHER